MLGAVCNAVRDACPTLPIGVTTAAWIEPDVSRRINAIATWTVLPDCASVNLGEPGAIEVIELLNARGVGVEAQSPRLHHGGGVATWRVIEAAMERGRDVRIGLEDTLVWPDGTVVEDNAALVARVAELARRAGRVAESRAKSQRPGAR